VFALVVELVDTQDLDENLSAYEETHRVEPFKFGEALLDFIQLVIPSQVSQ